VVLDRTDAGVWELRELTDDEAAWHNRGATAKLVEYMNRLDPAFSRARERSPFQFILSLLRVRSLQDAGWDPYETTQHGIPLLLEAQNLLTKDHSAAARHLALWIYGHILEASEPYELLANLIDVSTGGRFRAQRFPPHRKGRPQSPGEKISVLDRMADEAGMPQVTIPLRDAWDRELRNAIFHADYAFSGSDVRLASPTRSVSQEELSNRFDSAVGYHHALAGLFEFHVRSFEQPCVIPADGFSPGPENARVVVREGYGVVGLKHAWTREQLAGGRIPWLVGRFRPGEAEQLHADPDLALLPGRQA